MDREEFVSTISLMTDDAAAIIRHNQVLAGIKSELDANLLNPFEQDYIYREHFGQFPAEPKRQTINGVAITSRILHQTGSGLSDVAGADFLYEIEDEKFIIIQYKLARKSAVRADADQLDDLISNCPDVCMHKKKRPIPKAWLPLKLNAFCGCWYSVIDGADRRFVHACEAETIFQNVSTVQASEFSNGLSPNTFFELFSSCRIGAFLRQPRDEAIRTRYVEQSLESAHIIYEVIQSGSWTKQQ
jgi:hypothetical protein